MIRGYLSTPRRRPFVHGLFAFPSLANRQLTVELLIDTGADRTVLAPVDALRLGLDVTTLPSGPRSTGIGGQMATRRVEAMLTLDSFVMDVELTILVSPARPLPIPSLLGRDVLARLALFLDQSTGRVLLLEPGETEQIVLP